ncbi:MAG: shikimate dehydrogenase [Bacteroidetes bacterium]|nr:shikimate dehydrogenase [Bacteroidota bacterium]
MVKWRNSDQEQSTALLGLIGYPLGHSWSAGYFNEKFRSAGDAESRYALFPLENPDELPGLLEKYPKLTGLNVTTPFKETIIPFLDELDETAGLIGAVNTIKVDREHGLIHTKGFNTDTTGFLQTIKDHTPQTDALILGTGGAAKAVAYALKEKNIPFKFVSRKKKGSGIISYQDLTFDVISNHLLIINATPLGMYPTTDYFPPIPYHFLACRHCLYDLIYNPEETIFLKRGKAMKTQTFNGLQMLINQAELSYQIFFENQPELPVQANNVPST